MVCPPLTPYPTHSPCRGEELASLETLTLMSAELAARNQDQATGQVELLYHQLSTDEEEEEEEEEDTSTLLESHSSPEPPPDPPPPPAPRRSTLKAPKRTGVATSTEGGGGGEGPPVKELAAVAEGAVAGVSERALVKTAVVTGEESVSEGSEEDCEVRGIIASASLRSLSSLFGQPDAYFEQEIARGVGLEQLTRLSRATSARVVVHHLHVNPSAVEEVLSHCHQQHSDHPLPTHTNSALQYVCVHVCVCVCVCVCRAAFRGG